MLQKWGERDSATGHTSGASAARSASQGVYSSEHTCCASAHPRRARAVLASKRCSRLPVQPFNAFPSCCLPVPLSVSPTCDPAPLQP